MNERTKIATKTPISKKEKSVSQADNTKLSQHTNSPIDHILYLQRTIGNQAVGRLFESGAIQAKLKMGQHGDKYEQEADRVAEEVIRMPEQKVQRQLKNEEEEELVRPKPLAEQITPLVQRQVEEEEEEETIKTKPIPEQITPLVQRELKEEEDEDENKVNSKGMPGQVHDVNSNLESRIKAQKGGGRPLSESERAFFEPRFGCDFSQVRVHTDAQAAELAQAVNAQAFTMGQDVVFGAGQYVPVSSSGKRLLGHELTHVVQQTMGKVNGQQALPSLQRQQSAEPQKQIELKILKYDKFNRNAKALSDDAEKIFSIQCGIKVKSEIIPVEDKTEDDIGSDKVLDFSYWLFFGAREVDKVKQRAKAAPPNQVPVALVKNIKYENLRNLRGFCKYGLCAVSNKSEQTHVLAHEVGHFFLGPGHNKDPFNLMYENSDGTPTARKLNKKQCKVIKGKI